MKITIHHLKSGDFAAEVTTPDGPRLIFSSVYESDAARESPYEILSTALRRAFGIILPPLSETALLEPGSERITARIE